MTFSTNNLGRHKYILVYLVLSLLILWNLLRPGYIITLDMIFSSNLSKYFLNYVYGINKIGNTLTYEPLATFLFFGMMHLLNIFLPSWLIQKILLVSILVLSGISIHRLVPVKSSYAKYFAGFLYMVNPFIYTRFLAGQLYVLWGYAILPFVVKSFLNLFKDPCRKNIVMVGLFTSLVIPQTHFVPMVFGIFILFLLINMRNQNKANLIKASILVIGIFIILNISWIFPILSRDSQLMELSAQVGPEHLTLFTSRRSLDFNVVFTIAAMYGFWRGGYDLPKTFIPKWYLLFFFILFLTVHGFILGKDNKELGRYVKSLGLVAVVSLILATGVTHKHFSKIFYYLYKNIPFFALFREPQKLVALIAFIYAYLGAISIDDFAEKINTKEQKKKWIYSGVIIFAMITPFIYTNTMLFGFNGQLKSVDYPRDWYEVDRYLNKGEGDFNVLFLPWHGYMDFRWIKNKDKRIANPASDFFKRPIIQGDTIEAGGVYSQSTNSFSKYLEFLLAKKDNITNFGELVAPLDVKYIILAKEADYPLYEFLFNQSDLELVIETENLYLLKNKNSVSKIYATDSVSYIKDWDELLEKSKVEDITSKVYILGEGKGETGTKEKQTIDFIVENPTKYVLKEETDKKYIVFVAPYSENWKLDREKPMNNLGITNAYKVKEMPKSIENSRYKPYLLGYIISIAFLIILIKEVFT